MGASLSVPLSIFQYNNFSSHTDKFKHKGLWSYIWTVKEDWLSHKRSSYFSLSNLRGGLETDSFDIIIQPCHSRELHSINKLCLLNSKLPALYVEWGSSDGWLIISLRSISVSMAIFNVLAAQKLEREQKKKRGGKGRGEKPLLSPLLPSLFFWSWSNFRAAKTSKFATEMLAMQASLCKLCYLLTLLIWPLSTSLMSNFFIF